MNRRNNYKIRLRKERRYIISIKGKSKFQRDNRISRKRKGRARSKNLCKFSFLRKPKSKMLNSRKISTLKCFRNNNSRLLKKSSKKHLLRSQIRVKCTNLYLTNNQRRELFLFKGILESQFQLISKNLEKAEQTSCSSWKTTLVI
jgi:hypothetical protein